MAAPIREASTTCRLSGAWRHRLSISLAGSLRLADLVHVVKDQHEIVRQPGVQSLAHERRATPPPPRRPPRSPAPAGPPSDPAASPRNAASTPSASESTARSRTVTVCHAHCRSATQAPNSVDLPNPAAAVTVVSRTPNARSSCAISDGRDSKSGQFASTPRRYARPHAVCIGGIPLTFARDPPLGVRRRGGQVPLEGSPPRREARADLANEKPRKCHSEQCRPDRSRGVVPGARFPPASLLHPQKAAVSSLVLLSRFDSDARAGRRYGTSSKTNTPKEAPSRLG